MDTCLDPIAASKGEAVLPRSINPDGTFWVSNHLWWCSGFFPGTLWYVYEYTGDEAVKALAQNYYGIRDVQLIRAVGLDIEGADPEEIIKAELDSISSSNFSLFPL